MADETILDLPVAANLGGTEAIWIVQGGTDRRTTTGDIAGAAASIASLPTTVITSGSTYAALPTDVLIIVNKTVGSPTTIVLPASTSKSGLYYIKDGKGDAGTNNITVDASGGELFDGSVSVPISTDYGLVQVAPSTFGSWVLLNFG